MYAFGMTVLEMVTGITPYHECTSTAQIYRKVLNGLLPNELDLLEKLNPRCCSLVRACLQKESSRPSATDLLSHDFFRPNEEEDFLEVRVKISKDTGILDALAEDDGSDDEEDSIQDDKALSRAADAPATSPDIDSPSDTGKDISPTIPTDKDTQFDNTDSNSFVPSGDRGSSTRVRSRLIQLLSPSPKEREKDSRVDGSASVAEGVRSAPSRNPEAEKPLVDKSGPSAEIFVLDVLVVNSVSSGGSQSIRICLRVSARKESKEIDVEFEFDLLQDSTSSVALEMRECEELKGVDIDASAIVEAIDPFVESSKKVTAEHAQSELYGPSLSELVIRDVLAKPENSLLPCTRILKAREEEKRARLSFSIPKSDVKSVPSQALDKEKDIAVAILGQPPSLHQSAVGRITAVEPTIDDSYDDLDETRVLPIDIDDDEDEKDPEYLDIIAKAQEIIIKYVF